MDLVDAWYERMRKVAQEAPPAIDVDDAGPLLHLGAGIGTAGPLLYPHYQPPEKGRPANEWATNFEKLHPDAQKFIRTRLKERTPRNLDTTHKGLVDSIKGMYLEAKKDNPQAVKAGHRWYKEAHNFARDTAKQHGISLRQSLGMTAALSPQTHWEENKTLAGYIAHHMSANADSSDENERRDAHLNIHPTHAALYNKEYKTNIVPGKAFRDMSHDEAAQALKAQAQFPGQHFAGMSHEEAVANYKDAKGAPLHPHGLKVPGRVKKGGDPWRATFSTGTKNMAKAIRIHRGEDPDSVLQGHKVRSFFNNMADPHNKKGRSDVTMDTHAVSLGVRAQLGASSPEIADVLTSGSQKAHNLEGSYAHYASAYREAHRQLVNEGHMSADSHPHQLQAATWLHWRDITGDGENGETSDRLAEANKGRFPKYSKPIGQQRAHTERVRNRNKVSAKLWLQAASKDDPGELLDPYANTYGEDPDWNVDEMLRAEQAEWETEPEEMELRRQEAEHNNELHQQNNPHTSAVHQHQSPSINNSPKQGYGLEDEGDTHPEGGGVQSQAMYYPLPHHLGKDLDEFLFEGVLEDEPEGALPYTEAEGARCKYCNDHLYTDEDLNLEQDAHAGCEVHNQSDRHVPRHKLDQPNVGYVLPHGPVEHIVHLNALEVEAAGECPWCQQQRLPGEELGEHSLFHKHCEDEMNAAYDGDDDEPAPVHYPGTRARHPADDQLEGGDHFPLIHPDKKTDHKNLAEVMLNSRGTPPSWHSPFAEMQLERNHRHNSLQVQADGGTGMAGNWSMDTNQPYSHGGQTPNPKPEEDGDSPYREDNEGKPTPSDWWQQEHSTSAENPASTGPSSFGNTLDPAEYPLAHGQTKPDEKLLAPGPSLTSMTFGPQWGFDYMASLKPYLPHEAMTLSEARQAKEEVKEELSSLQPAWLAPGGAHEASQQSHTNPGNSDIAKAARAHLAALSAAEQEELIHEGEKEGVLASNYDLLDLRGTHYASLEEEFQKAEAEAEDLFW